MGSEQRMYFFRCSVFLLSLLALGLESPAVQAPVTDRGSQVVEARPQIGFIQTPLLLFGELGKRFPQGSRLVRMATEAQPRTLTNLTPQFFAVADPQVSFDGRMLLFSGQMKKDGVWQIWEMDLDGSDPHQLTRCRGDCLQPAYLPRNQIVYTSVDRDGPEVTSALFVCEGDGKNAHPITFGPGDFQVETVMHGGRILVSAESPLHGSGKALKHRTLYTINPDGTGLSRFRQDASAVSANTRVEELEDGTVLFVQASDSGGPQGGGAIAWIAPGALRSRVITAQPFVYESVHELQTGTLLVAKQSSVRSIASRSFDLYTFDLASKSLLDRLDHQPGISDVSAVALVPRSAPLSYPSILHPEEKVGRVLCLNSYVSADAPHGHIATSIVQVRVTALEQGNHERVLGSAPVEKDGSFYMAVPSDVPIRFELLDEKGSVIRAQKSWIWARPGEDRGCLGCHEDQALAPENHWPLTLNRFDTPTPVGVSVHP